MSAEPLVALIIPTWNRKADVVRCIASLERLTYRNFVTVIVDNGSADGTAEALRARYPDLVILRQERNRGYAGGNNAGIRWAWEHGAAYVFLINNDTEVTPELLSTLVRVAEADPRIGVVGCRNLLMEDPARMWGAFGVLTYGPFLVRTAGQGERDAPFWHVVRDVDWVIGNGSLWKRAALEEVGLLDEEFFAYHDDVDWCTRVRRAGYRVVYVGTAAIVHKGGSSSDVSQQHAFPVGYFLGRNGVLFVRKYASAGQRWRFALLCGGALAARLMRALLLQFVAVRRAHRMRWATEWQREVAFARGVVDAVRGRPIPFARLGLGEAAHRHPFAGADEDRQRSMDRSAS